MLEERRDVPKDPDYSAQYEYSTTGPCCIARLWVDHEDGLWLESNDGQRVVIPRDGRKLVANRVKGAMFR